MHRFTLWAPSADRVDVLVAGERHAMTRRSLPERPGWWLADVADAGPGTKYEFSIDGGQPRPDPRSPSQPEGIDGPSQVVDHEAFPWTDDGPSSSSGGRWRGIHLPGAVLYELHVGTFTPDGTFDAAIDRLGELRDLGIDAVELLPVAEFSGERGWGYDGVDLFAPHHAYGGPDGLKRFVDAAHQAGIGVVVDVVYNHLGPAGNYLAEFGPYFSDRHRTNWGEAVNFDGPGSDEVRRFVVDNASMWLRDYRCDGLRLDAVHAMWDSSAVHVLEQLGRATRLLAAEVRRPLFLIAESDLNDPVFVRSTEAGGYGLDAAWADEFHHALHAVLTGETSGYYADFGSIEQLAKALRQAWVYDGKWSPHRQRTQGRPSTGLPASAFVVSLQNHDQVGNRAQGDRIGSQISEGRLKIGAALLLLSPFVPMLFQGEEWSASSPFQYFTDHHDEALGRAVSDGRRSEFASFGWEPDEVPDPQAPESFTRSHLDWDERRHPDHAEILSWYRDLIALRHRLSGLAASDVAATTATSYDEDAGWLVVRRPGLLVAANLGSSPATVTVTVTAAAGDEAPWHVELASNQKITLEPDGNIELPADSVAVLTPGTEHHPDPDPEVPNGAPDHR